MEKPVLSPDFTLDDIRKIRTYNDKLRQTMTKTEYRAYIKQQADECRKMIKENV
jgi:hypothetical protein